MVSSSSSNCSRSSQSSASPSVEQYDDMTILEDVPPEEFLDCDVELLETAYEKRVELPFDELDVSAVNQQDKDVNGAGRGTAIIGRLKFTLGERTPEQSDVKKKYIFVCSLVDPSHENTTGPGAADFAH